MDNLLRPSHLRLAAIFAALAIASTSLAQGVTGSALTGKVVTPEGQAIPDAVVELRNDSTGADFIAVSDSSGGYLFDNVPPGKNYSITVSADGYYGNKRTGMQMTLGSRNRLDIQLRKTETLVEEINVVATDTLRDRGNTGPTKALDSAQILDLPVQGRNFTDLISTAPQVSGTSMAGQNNRFNNIQIDGASYNDLFGLVRQRHARRPVGRQGPVDRGDRVVRHPGLSVRRALRQLRRRHGERGDQERHQRGARLGLRVLPEQEPRRQAG